MIKHYCDICGNEIPSEDYIKIKYPVIFYTDQTEGRSCAPYIDETTLEVCIPCAKKILRVTATGAQGLNYYEIVNGEPLSSIGLY